MKTFTFTVPNILTLFILMLVVGILVASPARAQTPVGAALNETPEGDLVELPKENDSQSEVIYDRGITSSVLASPIQHVFVSASSFVPINSSMTYAYSSGCIYHTGGLSLADYSLQLPQGAVITAMQLYFYDNSTEDATLYLFRCTGSGSCVSFESVSSSGTSGYSNATVAFSRTVDNSSEALVLRLSYADAIDSTLKICGVRVQYEYNPFSALFLPMVTK